MLLNSQPKSTWLKGIDLEGLSDEAYFLRCRAVGFRMRHWDDCYIGLIVGAVDRTLPQKNGFRDIYHMAGVQARMTRKRVTEVLSIARTIRPCPRLFRMFTRAEASWTKVRAVARLASPERDAELCEVVQRMTRAQLRNWIREQSPSRPRPAIRRNAPAATGAAGHSQGVAASDTGRPVQGSGPMPGDGPGGILDRGSQPVNAPAYAHDHPGERGREASFSGSVFPPVTPTTSVEAGAESPQEPTTSARLGARALEAVLIEAGVDPLVLDKLRVDRAVLAERNGATPPLIDVLEQAIRAHRPAGRSVRLPYLNGITTCRECACRVAWTTFGPLPVDELDAHHLRQSGATVDIDQDRPDSGRADEGAPEANAAPRQVESAESGEHVTTTAKQTGAVRENSPGSARGDASPVSQGTGSRRPPARTLRLVLARQGGRCAVRNCLEVLGQCHHLTPHVWIPRHDANQMFWLCRRHHDLAHAGGIANPGETPDRWRPKRGTEAPVDERRESVDRAVRRFRTGPLRRDESLARLLAPEDPDEQPS